MYGFGRLDLCVRVKLFGGPFGEVYGFELLPIKRFRA